MEEKGIVFLAEDQRVQSRRSRKDQEGRDYQCGCGKRYLSYPALYTHIKTKHDGRQPQGTLKTGTNPITKRAKSKLEEQILKQIYTLFNDFQLQTTLRMDQALKGSIALSYRIKKDGVPKQVYDQYILLTKQQQLKLTDTLSLDLALVLFLVNVGELVNDKVYEQFLIFARLARACFFEHGEQIHRAIFLKKDTGPFQMKDFNVHNVKYFPMVSDFLIRLYIPETDNKDTKQANSSLMEIITYDFCNWLHKCKFTAIRVALSRNVQIDFKPPVQVKQKVTPGKAEEPKQLYEKEIKEENQQQSQELSDGEEIQEDLEPEDKNPSGSKDHQLLM